MLGVGGGDPARLREAIASARLLADEAERAARLFFLGLGLLGCDGEEARREGRATLIDAARLGNPYAAHDAAVLLLRGEAGEADPGVALGLLESAAAAGLARSQVLLGRLWLTNPNQASAGRELLTKAGLEGSAEARYYLGLAYFRGLGGAADPSAARALQREAAEAGHAGAQFEYSLMLRSGLGGGVDDAEAERWEICAAEQGHARACLNRGARAGAADPPRLDETRQWYARAAAGGSADAARRLAAMDSGSGGTR